MSDDWFCKIEGKKIGPLTAQQLRTIVAKGKLHPEHLVRRGDEGPWVPAGRVKGLFPEKPPAGPGGGKQAPSPAAGGKPSKGSPPAGKALPTAREAPQPPAADLPEEFVLGPSGHKKHHVKMNVDRLHIEAAPVMVSGRKSRPLGLKKEEQKKLTMILLGVIGCGLLVAAMVFGWAAAHGMLSLNPAQEEVKKEEAKFEEPAAEKKSGSEKKAGAAKGKESETWNMVPLDSVVNGSVEVKVIKPLRGPPPEGSQVDRSDYEEVLMLPVNLNLKEGAQEAVEFKSWAETSVKRNVVLKDDLNAMYQLLDMVSVKGDGKTIAQHKGLQVRLLFRPPTKRVKYLRLELPASAFGGEGMLKFEVPAKLIPPPADKEPAEKSPEAKPKKAAKAKPASSDDEPADTETKPKKAAKAKPASSDDEPADTETKPKKAGKKQALRADADGT
jgi:hypothetical protein